MSHVAYIRAKQERLAQKGRATRRSNSMSPFEQPSAPGGGIKWEDHKGALLLVEPTDYRTGISTAFGVADAVEAKVSVIEGPGAPETYDSTLVFPKLLTAQLKGSLGKRVLGRLGQGAAKAGQSAPWLLEAATAEDIAKAEAWVQQNAQPSVTSAAPPF